MGPGQYVAQTDERKERVLDDETVDLARSRGQLILLVTETGTDPLGVAGCEINRHRASDGLTVAVDVRLLELRVRQDVCRAA